MFKYHIYADKYTSVKRTNSRTEAFQIYEYLKRQGKAPVFYATRLAVAKPI